MGELLSPVCDFRARFGVLLIAVLATGATNFAARAQQPSDSVRQSARLIHFSIPAQPIASALDAYGAATGLEVYYDGALASGRRSSAVVGWLAAEAGLRELLVGTGLVLQVTGEGSITVVPARHTRASSAAYQSYFAGVQSKIAKALCSRGDTRPGEDNVLLKIWIASSGVVQQIAVLDSVDAQAYATALRGVAFAVPPVGMPQPVTVAILARRAGEPTGCPDPITATR
jgi:hypothetical protein